VYVDAEIKENDLLGKTETSTNEKQTLETHPLHALQQAIAAMPAIDQDKVEAAIAKLRNDSLGILGSEAERLASAERIARQIMDESSNCDTE